QIFILFLLDPTIANASLQQLCVQLTYEALQQLLEVENLRNYGRNFLQYQMILKNCAHFLGQLTLAQNRPLKSKFLDLKGLLKLADEQEELQGLVGIVLPFVTTILRSCKASKVFCPKNPWTEAILTRLAELWGAAMNPMNAVCDADVADQHL
ncbi:unnamed protein product, partial [Amoebophrya sp. A120]